jgi:hypothetical protein
VQDMDSRTVVMSMFKIPWSSLKPGAPVLKAPEPL